MPLSKPSAPGGVDVEATLYVTGYLSSVTGIFHSTMLPTGTATSPEEEHGPTKPTFQYPNQNAMTRAVLRL
jgi:hypothetical protein